MRPQTDGYGRLSRDDDAGVDSQPHPSIPAILHTVDARRSGIMEPQRRSIGAVVQHAPAAGGSDRLLAYLHVGTRHALAVHRIAIAVIDGSGGAYDIDTIEAGGLYRAVDYAHLLVRQPPGDVELLETSAVIPAGGATAQPLPAQTRHSAVAYQWTAAALQLYEPATPIVIQGGRGATDLERDGLAIAYRRNLGVGDVDAVVVWADVSIAPRGVEPV